MAKKTDDPSSVTETITVKAKPSGYKSSTYYPKGCTKTWKNWCPQCKRVGCLTDDPKGTGDHEITCDKSKGGCDADYDGCTGGDKMSPPRAYLMDTNGRQNSNGNIDTEVGGNGEGGDTIDSSSSNTSGGSAIKIPDRTFHGLIRQICGATDSIFITANNMAYLLTFRDYYKYREKYADLLPTLEANEIVANSLKRDWVSTNFYNMVEVKYKGGTLKYGHDALIAQYGELKIQYDLGEDDYETAKSKAAALLSAHVRDYATDIELSCIYDENITVGSWVKVRKTIIDSKKTKDNANSSDYDILFIQGYDLTWDGKKTLIMDLHLKYSPDTPQDPINATIGVGGKTSSGTSSTGPDCFGVETSQLYNDRRIPGSGKGGLEYATANEPSAEMTQGRCKEGSSYQQEMNGKTPAEVYYWASQQFGYCCYANNCKDYKCTEERLNAGVCGFNCGDQACILKSLLDCIGIRNWIFHIDGHYHNIVEIDGTLQTADLSRRRDGYTHSVKWPCAHAGRCHCNCATC